MESKSSLPLFFQKPSGTQLLGLLSALLVGLAVLISHQPQLNPSNVLPLWIPVLVSAIMAGISGVWIVPLLRRLKTGQIIREEGPQAHLKKAGTPTMGGLIFLPVGLVAGVIFTGFDPEAIAVALVTLAYGVIGWVDDWQVLRLKSNKGISPRMKLILQIAIAVVFCIWLAVTAPELTTITFFAGLSLPLGIFFWALAGFAMVAESNATNLTDGVDGLAGGTGAIAFLGVGALALPEHPGLSLLCACLSGACLGFIYHNRNPAKVFMGDTGSLALGGGLAAAGILSGNIWGLLIISGIFCIEAVSVIAQVSYYKATKDETGQGKRLLKMAPIHHHLELSGWPETQIVGAFYLINLGLVLLSFVLT
ncbi:phospho-N-acetylmuramoyl-pentapeptide-transferase [Picosynechococcus sp. PCC 7003]|uniref:phospho-N-acetylmuramoyl-pentapeptide- transferase n=1 Tax=Picosynechococcus sp. PCC 7003 TaxID=374981 RepID=UPI000810BB8D|nr:phospho-N-acetylmuramoyl-pentapeptide-transferase [Picosynechococcus sp. PCC 7003]ANV84295.1 phospho-N-acetylmuramoyl-pentapeptide-transferase [Picosynechococcus sp. PCC 7003]